MEPMTGLLVFVLFIACALVALVVIFYALSS